MRRFLLVLCLLLTGCVAAYPVAPIYAPPHALYIPAPLYIHPPLVFVPVMPLGRYWYYGHGRVYRHWR